MSELATNQQLTLVTTKVKESKAESTNSRLILRWEQESGRLSLQTDDGWKVVKIKSCFPWSQSKGFFSLRDNDKKELGFVERLEDLEEDSQRALLYSLKESCFHFSVTELLEVREEFELRFWKVNTLQGERCFQTRLTDWPRHLGDGFYIIEDVQKDLFVIEDISKLNESGKKLFWPFTDE